MRPRTALMLAAGLFALAAVFAAAQDRMTEVDTGPFANPQRPASAFVHDEHNERAGIEECAECHHVYADGAKVEGESSEDRRCAECHGPAAEGRKPSLTQAFHGNCKGCHLERRQGPIMCGQCHRRSP